MIANHSAAPRAENVIALEDPDAELSSEYQFARYLLEFLVKSIIASLERTFFQRNNIMWQTKVRIPSWTCCC